MYAVIRLRGNVNLSPKVKRAFKQINLTRPNHLVLLEENSSSKGQLKLLYPYITYGTINKSTLAKLIAKRGRLPGDKRLSEEWLKEKGFTSFLDLAEALLEKKAALKKLGIKPVFRLHPPRKGFERKGIRKTYKEGGASGFRGDEINQLILKMI